MIIAATRKLPGRDVLGELREIWLAYHRLELCRDLDSLFLFRSDGMEVWCAIDDERSFQRLRELVGERQASFRIELYPTWPVKEKESGKEKGPPPGLWHNEELRSYFQVPGERQLTRSGLPPLEPEDYPRSETFLARRIRYFGEQLLEWATRMRRYAADLPALAWAAYDADSADDTRPQAREACIKHAREVGKYAERLQENLSHALPRPDKEAQRQESAAVPPAQEGDHLSHAERLSRMAAEASRRIYKFVYPDAHAVGLQELRNPGLLAFMAELAKAAAEFQSLLTARDPQGHRGL
ncbi:MAG: hypothetical protein ABIG68_07520 [Acidobacteriota bacterium]